VLRILLERLKQVLLGAEPSNERTKRVATLVHMLRNLALTVLAVIVVMVVLQEVGVPVGPLLTAAGIGGLAIGFGAQSLVKDVISGFFFLIEEQVRVGDVVKIAGTAGLVEKITLRTVTLRDLAGNVHVVPHGTVSTVTNMTMDYSRYVFDVGVAYREDPDEVMAVLKEVGDDLMADPEFKDDILEPLEMLGVDQFGDNAVIIKCRITTRPIQQWRIGREMNRRIKKTFDQRGIEIPFPHRTLYWGEPKRGAAAPLHVRTASGEAAP
jgi:small conductance mechanosensitive channel